MPPKPSKHPEGIDNKHGTLSPVNCKDMRRSMVTSTPVNNRYSHQRLVQKPMLSPISSNNEGVNENVDLTMSEYQYDANASRDLFAEDTPPVSVLEVKNSQSAGDCSDEIVPDSVVNDSTVPDSMEDEVFESFASVSIREGDGSGNEDHENYVTALLNRSRSPLVLPRGDSSSMPSPAMCRSNAQYTPQTMRERLMRKELSKKHAAAAEADLDSKGRSNRFSKGKIDRGNRYNNDDRFLHRSPVSSVKKMDESHNDTASMRSFGSGSGDEEEHVESASQSKSDAGVELSASPVTARESVQNRMRSSASSSSGRRASESAKASDQQRVLTSDSDGDDVIFRGRKSTLKLDSTKPSYQTPRRRVIIESDSEDEDNPFLASQAQNRKNAINSDSEDSEDQDGEPDLDIVQANDTLDETVDLTVPVNGSGQQDKTINLSGNDSAEAEKNDSSDDEVQILQSSDEHSSLNSTRTSSAGKEASLDDSIQVVEVKPAPVMTDAETEQLRTDLESRQASLNAVKASSRLNALPDKGARILQQIADLERRLAALPPKLVKKNPNPIIPKMFEKKNVRSSPESSSGSDRGPEIIPAPKMNSNDMEGLISADKGKRLFGGKMTDNRMNNVFRVTGDAIEKIYRSLNNIPAETAEIETPKGLKVELMRHQKCGLAWMLWREQQVPPGGILADDMGLGKTISMISLMLHQKNARHQREVANDEADPERKKDLMMIKMAKDRRLIPAKGTLVIAPASLILQWEKEIERRVKAGKLDVHVYHGPKNKREKNPKRLAQYDVVITTYNLVATEMVFKDIIDDEAEDGEGKGRRKFNDSSVLAQVLWDRVILDEAHAIKNRTSNASRACCRISAVNRWCLTGTPIHNELWDLFSLIKFLRVSPFDEEKLWKEYIMTGRQAADRLNTLVKGLLLRRTKAQIDSVTQKPLVDLQPREFREVEVVLDGLEYKVYEQMFLASQQQVKQLLKNQEDMERYGMLRRQQKGGANAVPMVQNPFLFNQKENKLATRDNFQRMNCILVVLLKLRQACVHLALTRAHIDLDAFETLGAENDNDPAMDLNRELAEMSIAGDELVKQIAGTSGSTGSGDITEQIEALFEERYKSAKVRVLLKELDKVLEANDKCVIVSQWTSMLNIVERHLKRRDTVYTSITGAIPTKDRQERVDSFNMPDGEGSQVMLLSLTAGGVGLNLIGGNHLFLLDLHWNPALENQACDRIYRMGQKKNVYIHKFICKDTIEQRVLDLQKKKTEMAHGVLEGAASKKLTRLNMNDLKFLFDLNRPAEPDAAKPGPSGIRTNAPTGRPTASYAGFDAR